MSYKDFELHRSIILPEVLVIKPSLSRDLRGNINTTYNENTYQRFLPPGLKFIHDKFATSRYIVLRAYMEIVKPGSWFPAYGVSCMKWWWICAQNPQPTKNGTPSI
jgi:dTDP-4-dehydrorhamnose 3,5-epimerase-like enzyme